MRAGLLLVLVTAASLGCAAQMWPARGHPPAALATTTPAPVPAAAPEAPPRTLAFPPPQPASDLQRHLDFVLDCQRPSGAIAQTPAQMDINPYFANLAARSLLAVPGHASQVRAYMDWYLAHLNDDGTIDDYRVLAGEEQSLGRYDSADSYAATFLTLVDAFLAAGGDEAWVREHRARLEQVAGVVEQLTDEDGLTWARPYYPLKLLMDNAEVWQGLGAWGRILDRLEDAAAAEAARERASRVAQALDRFRLSGERYAWGLAPLGLRRGGNLSRFYPDAVAQFFPFALGMTDDPRGYWTFTEAHPRWHELTADRFPWMMAAVAAARAGDERRVRAALAAAAERHPDLTYPWYVGESAWVIELLTGVHPVASPLDRVPAYGPAVE